MYPAVVSTVVGDRHLRQNLPSIITHGNKHSRTSLKFHDRAQNVENVVSRDTSQENVINQVADALMATVANVVNLVISQRIAPMVPLFMSVPKVFSPLISKCIGSIPDDGADESQLSEFFSGCKAFSNFRFPPGEFRGFGFAEFSTADGAQNAIDQLGDKLFAGKRLRLSLARGASVIIILE